MKNRQRLGKTTVAIVVSTLAISNCAWGLPQGGSVVTGNGSYTSSGNQMDITGTGNVSVKWDSFNVAAGETVNFKNMNAILNYVIGRQGSEIFGALNGQGVHVFLINPNGILFGKTAQVNVGSLTASTKSLSDVDTALQNFKNSAGISDFGIAGTAELVNMGKLEADTLRFEGSRIVLDTDNIKLGGDDFDGSNAVINGDFANGNVVLGYTAHDANGYAGKDKNFDINGGAQSVKGYMWVTNAEQLQDINTNLSGNYALKNDIDAGSIANFVPIGNNDVFAGILDGLGNEIERLTIKRPVDAQVGLFYETAENSILRNLSLLDVDITGCEATGSLVGRNKGTIQNINVKGTIVGVQYTGGVAGYNEGKINNSEVDITIINSNGYTGGVSGYNSGIIKDGDLIVLDCIEGTVMINPDEATVKEYETKRAEFVAYKEELKKLVNEKTVTTDGHHVELVANIGSAKDLVGVKENGGEGVGLFRTEFLYMESAELPTEEQQFEVYKEVLEGMEGKPVVVRTLDIGGDKEIEAIDLPKEMNPFLGVRAIRLCFQREDIFRTQLRALLRASVYGDLRIMFPMIATLQEFRKAKGILMEEKEKLIAEGVKVSDTLQVGIMIEIPAAAVLAHKFAKEVDFFSVGTNDLVQYTFAADRMSSGVSYLYQPFNPSILNLLKHVIDSAHAEGKWAGMCGEMAGEAIAAPLLLGLGLDEFSMSATSILAQRKLIKSVSKADMEALVEKALDCATSEEVIELVKSTVKM